MEIKYIDSINATSKQAIEDIFDTIEPQKIACNNWAKEFPYSPLVSFKIFHTGELLHLRFNVEEQCTMARVGEDQGRVWTDSCVELFLSIGNVGYYNFETNCIGRMLLAYKDKEGVSTSAPTEIMETIQREPSIGSVPFEEITGDNKWSMTLAIPAKALFCHDLDSWCGVEGSMNLYKCGDDLSKPHFLSWNPIDNPTPNFHLPPFFRQINFL